MKVLNLTTSLGKKLIFPTILTWCSSPPQDNEAKPQDLNKY